MYCIGVDHHKQYSLMTVLDGEGREVKTGRMTNTRADIGEFLRGLEGEAKAVIEAGRASFEMAELLEDMGIDVTVAHAAKVKAIASARIKTDKRDARVLADLLRAGLIPSTYSSGDRTDHGRITKQGNGWLRWALVEAVYPAIKVDHDLRVYYQKIARRKGANVAKVATARRLLTIIHKMLKEGRAYVFYPREKTSAA